MNILSSRLLGAGLSVLLLAVPALGAAQTQGTVPASVASPSTPLRSPDGRRQIAAVRAAVPVRIDGALDDAVWREATPATGFVQSEPQQGSPATEETEVYVAYDDGTLYIAAYLRDREPDRYIVSEIRKDFNNLDQDSFEVILDTFADRRNGFVFMTNREGARADQQVANEGREVNASWDAAWSVKTDKVEDGWTLEMAIPFKSLRFERGEGHLWGINFSRRIRRKNEIVYWSPVQRAYNLARVSQAGDLVGLPPLSPGRNLRIKPYVLMRSVRETGTPRFDWDAEIGLDLKYGVTPSLTLDLTLNPDFAQSEADEQQANLTQFSQFFPEKREFFLENSGIFYVGDAQRNRVNPTPTPDEDLLLFFSRRIGLTSDGRAIPIFGGGRLTGNVGGVALGAMTLQTREFRGQPGNNYMVVRGRRNIFANSDIGGFFMSRQSAGRSGDYSRVYGVDATVRLFGQIDWSSFVVGTSAPGQDGKSRHAYRSTILWQGRTHQVRTGLMEIGEGFVSDLSYYRRVGMRKYLLETGYRLRREALHRRGMREMHTHVTWDYQTDLSGNLIAKKLHNGVTFTANNGGRSEPAVNLMMQQLTRPLRLSLDTPPILPGNYSWTEYQWRIDTDPSRMFSVSFIPTWGGLWSGTQKTVNLTTTVRPSHRFRASLGLQRTTADLRVPEASFAKNLWTVRTNYSFNTNMYLDSLLQYDTDLSQFNANVRFNLIHRPLSDLFIVYNEQQFTTPDALEPGRGLIIKFTRMMAF